MQIDVISDTVCPWCYIGKRRFEAALAAFPHKEKVTVVWRSFELDTKSPSRYSETLIEMLSRKYHVSLQEAEIQRPAGHVFEFTNGKQVARLYPFKFSASRCGFMACKSAAKRSM